MADQNVPQLTEVTAPADTDMLYVTVDPAGTPADRKVTVANLRSLPSTAGLTIVETSVGLWSGDAPARTAGVNPITFVGLTDPADVTNGIATPANINERDRWVQLDAL